MLVIGWNSASAVICTAALINEFARSKKMKSLDKEKTKEYDEYTVSYNYLLRKYMENNSYQNIIRYGFGLKISEIDINWIEHSNNENESKQFLNDLYY